MTSPQKPKECSLIVTTYNRPDALECVLLSILRQKIMPNEVIIADDGSTEETRKIIEQYAAFFPVPLLHSWQDDCGFRAAMSRNKAIVMSKYKYIVIVDGDMVLHKRFIYDHLAFAEKGKFLIGSRAVVPQKILAKYMLTKDNLTCFSSGIYRREKSLRCFLLAKLLIPLYSKLRHIKTSCNASFWLDDCIAVNGFDEDFVGWGGEDSDFFTRLINNNIQCKFFCFAGIGWHLWHDYKAYSTDFNNNKERTKEKMQLKRKKCENGIDKYLN